MGDMGDQADPAEREAGDTRIANSGISKNKSKDYMAHLVRMALGAYPVSARCQQAPCTQEAGGHLSICNRLGKSACVGEAPWIRRPWFACGRFCRRLPTDTEMQGGSAPAPRFGWMYVISRTREFPLLEIPRISPSWRITGPQLAGLLGLETRPQSIYPMEFIILETPSSRTRILNGAVGER